MIADAALCFASRHVLGTSRTNIAAQQACRYTALQWNCTGSHVVPADCLLHLLQGWIGPKAGMPWAFFLRTRCAPGEIDP